MENLICTVEHITYHNSESGYSVIPCKAKNYQDFIAERETARTDDSEVKRCREDREE